MNDTRYFAWSRDMGSDRHFIEGPYFDSHATQCGGRKQVHTLEEVMKISFSKSILKRIGGLKPGNEIRLHYVSRGNYFYIKRLTEQQWDKYKKVEELKIKLHNIRQQINSLIPLHLKHEEKNLKKELDKIISQGIFL